MKTLFTVTGKVKSNKGRGKQLGYPTANIDVPVEIEDGIYTAITEYENIQFPSLIFIGAAVTFGESDRKGEVYILDFDKDIYSKEITVLALRKQRGNKMFASQEDLIRQMKRDEEEAREYFQVVKLRDTK